MDLIFVYGTLKDGFRNRHVNQGRRLPGEYLTVQAYPLYLLGDAALPWLLPQPGRGLRVLGQIFEVDAAALARMDELECIDRPDWYLRATIELTPADEPGSKTLTAMVYFGSESGFAKASAQGKIWAGPLPEYTAEHATSFALGSKP